jgi:hypothetical protein
MKSSILSIFLLCALSISAQKYMVDSEPYRCVVYNISTEPFVVDTIYGCSVCTTFKDHIFSLGYKNLSFNPTSIIALSEWEIRGYKAVKVSEIENILTPPIRFDKVKFSLADGFLIGYFKNENCDWLQVNKIMLWRLGKVAFRQFFLNYFSAIKEIH